VFGKAASFPASCSWQKNIGDRQLGCRFKGFCRPLADVPEGPSPKCGVAGYESLSLKTGGHQVRRPLELIYQR